MNLRISRLICFQSPGYSATFVDPSLAVAAMRATPVSLRSDLNTFGFLFESLVIRDLRIYAQPLDGEVFHYRDQADLEIDAIIDTGDSWAAIEVKLGIGQIDEAAANRSLQAQSGYQQAR